MPPIPTDREQLRLAEASRGVKPWRRWGPYLSERQWGTVREDYSPDGSAWSYFPHDHARSRAYRWGEDGIAGISDDAQRLCFALALWNGKDPILKERLFGLTGPEGNHGEDVKELYYYLDATPTHSCLKMLYKYPQRAFPYAQLVEENRRRSKQDPEFELLDTGIFDDDRYFDIIIEYVKADTDDLLIQITAHNRGPDAAPLHVMPQFWFRNTWSWCKPGDALKPSIIAVDDLTLHARHPDLGSMLLYAEPVGATTPRLLFTENETNVRRLWNDLSAPGFFKDGFHEAIIRGNRFAVNPGNLGTKAAFHYTLDVPAHGSVTIRLRLTNEAVSAPFSCATALFDARRREADVFYEQLQRGLPGEDRRLVHRQALAGMIWSKQFYYFDIDLWKRGDPGCPPPPGSRRRGRNTGWEHLNNADIISMPDKWEYPWYAAWDLAFHCIPLAIVDPEFAKDQLLLLTREWYMHPNGQLPAYEWQFGDVNPPVHAWATWRVFEIDRDHRARNGGDPRGDLPFLERLFHKLLLNFTWWVNRKDVAGRNIFQGGFLGLDNIGVFDRSAPLPTGGHINQADGTSWMGMFCLNMLRIALELARHNHVYEDVATKFFEHFLHIAAAMRNIGCDDKGGPGRGIDLWDQQDEFFYDVLSWPDGNVSPLKVRSLVGLIPLLAVEVLDPQLLDAVPRFKARLEWLLQNKPDLASLVSRWWTAGSGHTHLLSLLRGHRMKCLLGRMLDEAEFLSPFGIRALSRYHLDHPYIFHHDGAEFRVQYLPGESDSGLFGGNSNWRGPIWMPINFLLVEALRKFHTYYGDDFLVEHPARSGRKQTLHAIADDLAERLASPFLKDGAGHRPVLAVHAKAATDTHFRDLVLFHEYLHGETGRGVGASHQSGWTGLVAALLMHDELTPATAVDNSPAAQNQRTTLQPQGTLS
jgi:hypothetical protein